MTIKLKDRPANNSWVIALGVVLSAVVLFLVVAVVLNMLRPTPQRTPTTPAKIEAVTDTNEQKAAAPGTWKGLEFLRGAEALDVVLEQGFEYAGTLYLVCVAENRSERAIAALLTEVIVRDDRGRVLVTERATLLPPGRSGHSRFGRLPETPGGWRASFWLGRPGETRRFSGESEFVAPMSAVVEQSLVGYWVLPRDE